MNGVKRSGPLRTQVIVGAALTASALCACEEPPKPPTAPAPPRADSSPWALLQEASQLEAQARAVAESRVMLAQRQIDDALRAAYRALEIRRKTQGDAHADTWRTAELI